MRILYVIAIAVASVAFAQEQQVHTGPRKAGPPLEIAFLYNGKLDTDFFD